MSSEQIRILKKGEKLENLIGSSSQNLENASKTQKRNYRKSKEFTPTRESINEDEAASSSSEDEVDPNRLKENIELFRKNTHPGVPNKLKEYEAIIQGQQEKIGALTAQLKEKSKDNEKPSSSS